MNKVTLPEYYHVNALAYAEREAKLKKFSKNSKQFKAAYDEFLREAVNESLTPNHNPIDESNLIIVKTTFSDVLSKFSDEGKKEIFKAVELLVKVMLKEKLGLTTSALGMKSSSGKTKEEALRDNFETTFNRYRRMALYVLAFQVLIPLFDVDKSDFTEIMEANDLKGIGVKELNKEGTKMKFAVSLRNKMKSLFSKINLKQLIFGEIKKVS